jgi:DNA anti-recombination protein RmuC
MRAYRLPALLVAAVVAVVAGCGGAADSWRQEAAELADAAESRLQEISAKMDSLQESAVTATADARQEIDEQMRELEEKQSAARERLAELREATRDRWSELRRRLDEAMDALERTIAGEDSAAVESE